MNKAIKVGLAGALFIGATLGIGNKYNQMNDVIESQEFKIERLQQEKVALSEANKALYDKVVKFDKERKALIEEKDKLSEQLKQSQSDSKKLKDRIIQLEKKIKEVEGNIINVEATAYTPFCNTGCIGITATGHNVKNTVRYAGLRIIAVDPNIIPLYSIVEVHPENEEPFKAIALDTGGDIKGMRIDFLVQKKSRAWEFGRQKATVKVLKWG